MRSAAFTGSGFSFTLISFFARLGPLFLGAETFNAKQAREFLNHGFKNIHIVDLDGALEGKLINKKIIKEITKKNEFKIQVGGGIRSLESIEEWLDIGVDKVVIGTAAIENPEFLTKACNKYKGKIALAIDVILLNIFYPSNFVYTLKNCH